MPFFFYFTMSFYSNKGVSKKLFTPGPLLTTKRVKQSMLVDLGSRDNEFINVIKFIQTKLLEVAGTLPFRPFIFITNFLTFLLCVKA